MLKVNKVEIKSLEDLGASKRMFATYSTFINTLIASPIHFSFGPPYDLKKFLSANLSHFQGAPEKFKDVAYAPLFEEVQTVTRAAVRKGVGKWFISLKVKTRQDSEFEISIFTSTKRHLLDSFLVNQHTPRKAMTDTPRNPRNSVVRDSHLFESYFVGFAKAIAEDLGWRKRTFGYQPTAMNSRVRSLPIAFETDSLPLTLRTDRGPLPIHCFPSTGREVRRVTQDQYGAMVKLLLWYFRSDERLHFVRNLDEVSRMRNEHGSTSRTYTSYMASIGRKRGRIEETLRQFFTRSRIDPAVTYGRASSLQGSIVFQVKRVLGDLHELLVKHGKVPDLQVSGMRPSTGKGIGTSGIKATVPDPIPTLVFKMNKREVKAVLRNMPWETLDWLLERHRTVRLSVIRQALEGATIPRGGGKPTLQEQIRQLRRSQLNAFIHRDRPWIAVNQLISYYNRAVREGVISRVH